MISSRVETDWPGHSAWSLLSNTALSRIVPLEVSTWLLISASVPVGKHPLAVGGERDRLRRGGGERRLDLRQLVFRRGEDHGDRLDLGDGHDAGLGRGIDDIADVDLAEAGDAGDRRLDGGVIELGLRVLDQRRRRPAICAVELRDGGALGVGLLPGREFAELGIALQVEIGVGEIGFVLRLLGLGLVERGLERPRIDLDQRVAFLDELAFLETRSG